MKRICRDVQIDLAGFAIRLEGVEFPFVVQEVPEVEVLDGVLGVVTLRLITESVEVNPSGKRRLVGDGSHLTDEVQRAWVKATVHNIIEERLADTLTWLRSAGRTV